MLRQIQARARQGKREIRGYGAWNVCCMLLPLSRGMAMIDTPLPPQPSTSLAAPSRRSFLHHLAAVGGTGLVMAGLDAFSMSMASAQTAPPALTGSGAGKRVVILGAGVGGMTAELLAKAVRKGTLDTPMSTEDKELFVTYLVREGYLSSKDLAYSGADGRGYDVWPGALTDPGPGKPGTPFALTDILHSRAWRTLRSVAAFTQQRRRGPAYGLPGAVRAGRPHLSGRRAPELPDGLAGWGHRVRLAADRRTAQAGQRLTC